MDDRKRQALQYLSQDSLLHIDMLESIRWGQAVILQALPCGVLILDRPSQAYMMSAADQKTAARLFSGLQQAELFVAHQKFYTEAVQKRLALPHKMACFQAVYPGTEPISVCDQSYPIRQLDESYLPFVWKHYSHADDKEYLAERLRSGTMFGAFADGSLAGFIGMHAEGSMGMLEVLPSYRRRGIAAALEAFQVNRFLAQKKIPFAQIICGNTPSVRLHQKLGFSISSVPLFWLEK
jgi:tRNA (guanine37-N1)-methyltransferase